MYKIKKLINFCFYLYFAIFISVSLYADEIKKFEIIGNDRISEKTIINFSGKEIKEKVDNEDLNTILKNLYQTDFFSDVSINFDNGILKINVQENPIVQSLQINGIKKKSIKEFILDNLKLREKNSFVKNVI